MTDANSTRIIVHGRTCPYWSEPVTVDHWTRLQLIMATDDSGSWTMDCPVCGSQVVVGWSDGGE